GHACSWRIALASQKSELDEFVAASSRQQNPEVQLRLLPPGDGLERDGGFPQASSVAARP
ncbi:MAG TPA: hypothetical protein VMJ93_15125, partial [Verrucomicrobiae bacterium]|nr:hypothetical protein [Verrucomicrobiae bacterium]